MDTKEWTMSHRVIIADALRGMAQNPEFRQELTANQCTILDQCLAPQEPSDEALHRVLRIAGRVYTCGD
jgi:hypothetical protein